MKKLLVSVLLLLTATSAAARDGDAQRCLAVAERGRDYSLQAKAYFNEHNMKSACDMSRLALHESRMAEEYCTMVDLNQLRAASRQLQAVVDAGCN